MSALPAGPAWFRLLSRRLGLPAPRVPEVRRETGIRVPVDDGVVLLADRWVPLDVNDPPLVLVRVPYGRGRVNGLLSGRVMAYQGSQVVVESCRGTGGSGGTFVPFAGEQADGAATVRWLRDQPWFPGGFATIGSSYLGFTELALAEAAGDLLQAMVLQVTPTSARDLVRPGGSLAWSSPMIFGAQVHRDPTAVVRNLLALPATRRRIDRAGRRAPLRDAYLQVTRGRVPFLEAWLDHADPDDRFWDALDVGAALDVIDCPVLVQTGWYDLFLERSVQQFRRLRGRGTPVELSVFPLTHLGFLRHGAGVTTTERVTFLQRVLNPEAVAPPAPVRLVEIGSGERVDLSEWPDDDPAAAGTSPVRLFLTGLGTLAEQPDPAAATSSSFTYDPANPTPAEGGPGLDPASGPRDQRVRETRDDVLVFDAAPVEHPTSIRGSVAVTLRFSSDRPSTDVHLRLCVVSDDGTSTNLTERLLPLTATARRDDGSWHVATVLPPTCCALARGHHLRLQVSSGAFPTYARPSGTGEDPAAAAQPACAHQLLHHSPAQPAVLTVPMTSATTAAPHDLESVVTS
jgi:uncharacterized protein